MNSRATGITHYNARGQSLVETAIFLPIILFLLAGALEVSNMLITQNRVQTAARVGTGFGATNYDENIAIEDTFSAMSMVALNNITETLDVTPERWDIYTVKATFNNDGDDFSEWIWDRPYGTQQVFGEEAWTNDEPQIKEDIRTAFEEDNAAGLEIVATVAYHHRHSFLGLGAFNPGLTRLRGLTVMRVSEKVGTYDGCDLFPITLNVNNISLYPENYAKAMVEGGKRYDSSFWIAGNQNVHIIDDHAYDDGPPVDHSGFPQAVGGHRLVPGEVRPGDIYLARQEEGPGNFGWLAWDGDTSAPALEESLAPPGNLSLVSPPPEGRVNYVNPYRPDDRVPSIGDWIQGATGQMNSHAIRSLLKDHVDSERQIQIIVFDGVSPTGGANFNYEIVGFVQVYLRAFNLQGSTPQILVEFIRWADPCFAPNPYPAP